ncbi:MAG: carbohydrate ABC transporter permease [Hyphomicrobiaceae bacterium]|nr:carbohydrate ABC transporter permease [Hyphomicrobiaceae bacterium]MCC0023185.1 carbohydrate ABC transporter permease [Hyphomicrobiaceae bacterium]
MRDRYSRKTLIWEVLLLLLAIAFCLPLYLLVSISLKPPQELFTSPLTFPTDLHFENFSRAWQARNSGGMASAMISSVIITVGSVATLIVIGSLSAYAIARRPGKLSATLYTLFVIGIIVPFQLTVLPLFVLFRSLGLIGTYLGMIILWVGILTPLTVFLYTGFVRTIPRDYEEAARMDGAGLVRTYVQVVFPLLRPITGTVAILTGLFIWNDFFASLIFLGGSGRETLPVAIYSFVGEYLTQWNLVFAAVVIALAPLLVFFLIAQKQMIRGFSGGIRG